ncbi:MAG: DUF2945 domain-containing protein [Alphaproteobacteria bacterium]|nr:DUF2945 domain-containing protein [Alphaproteobacteria bacterium]
MRKRLKAGDKVSWKTSQGRTTGHVVKKQRSKTKVENHEVAASPANPQFIVRSDKSGKRAAHKSSSLRRV